MSEFKVRVLDRLPPIQPARVLAALPEGSAPAWLDDSVEGCGYLAWEPDRELEGTLTPRPLLASEGGLPGPSTRWPLAQEDPARVLQAAAGSERWSGPEQAGQWGGWLGYFGWECGHAYLPFPWTKTGGNSRESLPPWRFARYRQGLWYTPQETLVLSAAPEAEAAAFLRSVYAILDRVGASAEANCCFDARLEPRTRASRFQESVAELRKWIGMGELFQANLSHELSLDESVDPRLLYAVVRLQQPTRHSAYFEDRSGRALLSWSPECFIEQRGRRLRTRPIKGTAARAVDPATDQSQAQALEESEKERAELTMIVDMARNDLGSVSVPGSVRVLSAGEVEAFPTLFHRTATVESQLREGLAFADWMAACFPPASVSGAPKVRALQAISELEAENRGPYCGAFGSWIPGAERADFSVLIRSASVVRQSLSLRVGAGIVWDSDPVSEWQETLLKARYMEQESERAPLRSS